MPDKIEEAVKLLTDMGLPKAQQNERTALCLLALLDMRPETQWQDAETPLVGITPLMDFAREHYQRAYAPNTRETFRRFSMHQLVEAGIARYNPDKPERPVNSPHAVYQISAATFFLAKQYGTDAYPALLENFKKEIGSLAERYQQEREMAMVPVVLASGQEISLSPGAHSHLLKEIIEGFAPRFIPGAVLLYVGDTGNKWGYFDKETFESIGLAADEHGKMPDVMFYLAEKGWLVLVESVTSHGPIDSKRKIELQKLFPVPLEAIYISAFPDRHIFARFAPEIGWETEAWLADNPTHMIHFNGAKFLG
jgi:type II restriction enzyme